MVIASLILENKKFTLKSKQLALHFKFDESKVKKVCC